MRKAARAIIIEGDKMLVMHRNKYGSEYYTLVGGQLHDNESLEDALIREVKEETGLTVTAARLVFVEKHPEPYNEQYIYLCNVAPHAEVAIQEYSEEALMNRVDINVHKPMWVNTSSFDKLQFRTPPLFLAIIDALKNGFPQEPTEL